MSVGSLCLLYCCQRLRLVWTTWTLLLCAHGCSQTHTNHRTEPILWNKSYRETFCFGSVPAFSNHFTINAFWRDIQYMAHATFSCIVEHACISAKVLTDQCSLFSAIAFVVVVFSTRPKAVFGFVCAGVFCCADDGLLFSCQSCQGGPSDGFVTTNCNSHWNVFTLL